MSAGEIIEQLSCEIAPLVPQAGSDPRAPATEYRKLHVGARRLGLQVRSRRGYVVGAMR